METGIRSIAISSLVGGFIYWMLEYSNYMFLMIKDGLIPLDSLVILIPILIFSFGSGMLLGIPSYILLNKLNINNLLSIVTLSLGIANIIGMSFLYYGDGDYSGVFNFSIAGILAGLTFYYIVNRFKVDKTSE